MNHLFAGHYITFLIWSGVQGALFGALLTSVVPRLAAHRKGGPLKLFERSECDACGRRLALWETTPILGFLFVRGRCRSCGGPCPVIYPVLELYGLLAGVATAVIYGPSLTGFLMSWVMTWLFGMGILFWKTGRLADAMTVPLLIGGVLAAVFGAGAVPLREAAAAGASVAAVMLALDGMHWIWPGGDGIEGGHAYLAAGIGLWLGFYGLVIALIGGSVLTATGRVPLRSVLDRGLAGQVQVLLPGAGMTLGAVLAILFL